MTTVALALARVYVKAMQFHRLFTVVLKPPYSDPNWNKRISVDDEHTTYLFFAEDCVVLASGI